MLNHDNIINIVEVHSTDDEVVVVMPLMKAGLLSSFIHNHPKMSTTVIREVMRQILEGLAYMDSMRVIHRDIKSSNILVEEYFKIDGDKVPKIKIADLGLAIFATDDPKLIRVRVGTPGYMAPELFMLNDKQGDTVEISSKLDVFSAGIIFFQLVAKRNPFKPNDQADVVKLNEAGKIVFDSILLNKFSVEGVDLMKKMLERNPKIRISAKVAC